MPDKHTELTWLGVVRQHWIGSHPYTRDHGLRLSANRRFSPRLRLGAQAAWYEQTHLRRKNDLLDGTLKDISLDATLNLTPTMQGTLVTGLSYGCPRSVQWRNNDRWVRLGVNAALPRGFNSRW